MMLLRDYCNVLTYCVAGVRLASNNPLQHHWEDHLPCKLQDHVGRCQVYGTKPWSNDKILGYTHLDKLTCM